MSWVATQAKESLVNLLGAAAGGEYKTVGYESLARGAQEYEGKNRTVRAFLSKGKFPKSGGSTTTPCQHLVQITLELVCTSASEVDIGTLVDPDSTKAQRAAALAGATEAAQLVDKSMDEFRDLLWDIIMAGQNQWLGLEKYKVGSRFITDWEKDRLVPMGEYCILTGYLILEFETTEETTRALSSTQFSHNETDFSPLNEDDTVQKTVVRTERTE